MLGFTLESAASPAANAVLAVEMAMGAALIVGMMLVQRKRFRAHAACQTAVVLLNLVVIAMFMVPSFHQSIMPGIPSRLSRSFYLLATAHGILGIAAGLLSLYVLLVAGTKLLPQRLRFTRYKLWMRMALIVWWLDLLLGIATYFRWYVRLS